MPSLETQPADPPRRWERWVRHHPLDCRRYHELAVVPLRIAHEHARGRVAGQRRPINTREYEIVSPRIVVDQSTGDSQATRHATSETTAISRIITLLTLV